MSVKTLFYQTVLQFNQYCFFRIVWSKDNTIQPIMSFQNIFSKFFYDLSAPQYLIYSKNDICGITSSRKTWSFLRKKLIRFDCSCFLISLIIYDQKTRILSFTRFLIILMKNGFNMMCFLSKKVLLSKDNAVSCILRLKSHLIFFEGTIIWFDLCSLFPILQKILRKKLKGLTHLT